MMISSAIEIKQVGKAFLVVVMDAPSAQYPNITRYHTAGVYWSEAEALTLAAELIEANHAH